MGVSRLDTVVHFDTTNGGTGGANPAGNVAAGAHSGPASGGYSVPVDGLVTFIVTGANGAAIALGGGTVTCEVSSDGQNWASVGTSTGGVVVWQGTAPFTRATLTGGTGATSLRVATVHIDMS